MPLTDHTRPRLLDLYCGAGGAAYGYMLAGFHVEGVDIKPQPHYRGHAFVQMDALEYLAAHGGGQDYAVLHASPPCQAYSALKHYARPGHPMLIQDVRAALQATGKPYVIENVIGAPLRWPLMLCGSMFGLQTECGAQLRRHRIFESNYLLMSPGHCRHGDRAIAVNGHEFRNEAERWQERRMETICISGDHPHNPRLWRAQQRRMKPATIMIVDATPRDPATDTIPQQNVRRNQIRETFSVDEARIAMGIPWMTMRELAQAIPPAYTQWIGDQLRMYLLLLEPMRP